MTSPDGPRPQDPASLRATLPESADATAHILERLSAHGAKHTRYAQRGEVARGGMGMILRVWDEDLRRELAMKVVLGETGQAAPGEIPPKVLGRFLEEAQVTGQLDHPGIVPVHELGLDERGAVFFTMRLVKGRDLKEIFERVQAGDSEWTQTRVLWVLLKVCEAMAYAHSKGVIHRDLKPANVMVGRFGEVYVMDWGLARVLGQPDRHDLRIKGPETSFAFVQSERRADASHSADSVLFTMDGDVVGTPAYMAPEQARGEMDKLGPRSDVYALGAMLYHLLTGEMPFVPNGARLSQHAVLRSALEGPPRPVHALRADAPDELTAICEKAMARDPAARYADMGALAEDLRAYLENRVVKAHRGGAWLELKKWVQRNRALALAWGAALFVALLGLGATAWVQVRGRREAERERARAQASEIAARESLAEAERQEAIARRERSNVLRLSAFQELDDLEREADALWPAVPARIADMRRWLARAGKLVAGLEPGADGDPGHRKQLEELRARAVALAPAERAAAIARHPRGAELERAERELASRRAAADVRAGRARPREVEVDPAALPEEAAEINTLAWPLVDPARTEYGREAEGLALARVALERSEQRTAYVLLDTIAWAQLGLGLDDDALASSQEALALAPEQGQVEYETYLKRIALGIEAARGAAGAAALAAAEQRVAELERDVLGAAQPRFERDDDRWWHAQLSTLVRRIEELADPENGIVRGRSSRRGWSVERRVEFASELEERTLGSAEARAAWVGAVASVRESPAYGGLSLAPQLGLVPLGPDPRSGLEEFADVATGTPPVRGADGELELAPGSGVVFVLIPGGEARLGAQKTNPAEERFDPEAEDIEVPIHTVELAPFLIAKHEMTQGQWRRFTGRRPSQNLPGTQQEGRRVTELSPVESVSWSEASAELARLGWSLPTEAQWEYAARAGTDTPWWTGESETTLAGTANVSDSFARRSVAVWPNFTDSLDDGHLGHAPVGSFEPNPFGLCDVTGNVFEWCRDVFGSYRLACAEGDGLRLGGTAGTRVVRGGSFAVAATAARVSKRDSALPELTSENVGLRPVRALDP